MQSLRFKKETLSTLSIASICQTLRFIFNYLKHSGSAEIIRSLDAARIRQSKLAAIDLQLRELEASVTLDQTEREARILRLSVAHLAVTQLPWANGSGHPAGRGLAPPRPVPCLAHGVAADLRRHDGAEPVESVSWRNGMISSPVVYIREPPAPPDVRRWGGRHAA